MHPQVRLCHRQEKVACLGGGDNVCLRTKGLVPPDMVVVIMAVDDEIRIAACHFLRNISQILCGLGGHECIVDKCASAQVNDA